MDASAAVEKETEDDRRPNPRLDTFEKWALMMERTCRDPQYGTKSRKHSADQAAGGAHLAMSLGLISVAENENWLERFYEAARF